MKKSKRKKLKLRRISLMIRLSEGEKEIEKEYRGLALLVFDEKAGIRASEICSDVGRERG